MKSLKLKQISELPEMNEQNMESELKKATAKYDRLIKRGKELGKRGKMLYEKKLDLLAKGMSLSSKEEEELTEFYMEDDCINHFFECEGYRTYGAIADFSKKIGVKRVIDIGCAYGHQSECFRLEEVDYIGINHNEENFFNREFFTYLNGLYPMELPVQKGDLGVSVLCLTWNCYLWEGEKTLREQCEALERDFDHIVLYAQKNHLEYVQSYFPHIEKIGVGLYYFSK